MDREWTIYDSTGVTAKAVVGKLEYNGTYKGDRYLSVTVNSPYPINFQIGDTLTYRGDEFAITVIPAAKRQAANGATGTAIVYEGIRFKSTISELQFTQFTDLVASDNNMHYTALGAFSFYVVRASDFGERLQACMDAAYGENVWTVDYGSIEQSKDFEMSISNNTSCWDALAQWSNESEVNFIVRGRTVTLGWQQTVLGHPFVYGRGNGLKSLTQVINADQKIITRLKAYGSERNIPYRYYNLKRSVCYGKVLSVANSIYIILDVMWSDSIHTGSGTPGHQGQYDVTIKYNNTTYSASIMSYSYNEENHVAIVKPSGMSTPTVNSKVYVTVGVNKRIWAQMEGDGSKLESMYVPRLMLPGFPDESLQAWANRVSQESTDIGEQVAALIDAGFTFSTDQYLPYIFSPNLNKYGQRDGEVIFDGSDEDWEEVYPTMSDMTVDDLNTVPGYTGSITYQNDGKIYQVLTNSNVQDNGVSADGKYEEGSKDTDGKEIKTTFTLRIPNVGFNPWQYIVSGETPTLSMQSGMCQSDHGEFEILGCKPLGINGDEITEFTTTDDGKLLPVGCKQYELTLERIYDQNINMYYPNSTYQVNAGDEYVLIGIEMADVYITAASVRLFLQSCRWMSDEDHEKPTYQPEIDNIFMASNPDISDGITEGMKMTFSDEELGITEGSVTISQLVIREGEGGENAVSIPQYDVTLSDDVEATLMQQVDNRIHIANADFSASFSALQRQKLSKISPDTAQELITFLQGIAFGNGTYGIDGNGDAILHDINAQNALFATLTAQEAHFFNLIIDEVKSVGGQLVITPANCIADLVEPVPGEADRMRVFFQAQDGSRGTINQWEVGDQAIHYEFDTTSGTTRNYWRLVVGVSSEPVTKTVDGVTGVMCHWIDLSLSDCKDGSSGIEPGDHISMLGNRTDASRQNAIIISAYNIPFIDTAPYLGHVQGIQAPLFASYTGINSFAITEANRLNVIAGNGNLLSGTLSVRSTLADGRPVNSLGTEEGNLLRNTSFTGDYESEAVNADTEMTADTPLWSDPMDHWEHENAQAADSIYAKSGRCVSLTAGSISQTVGTATQGEWYMLSFFASGDSVTVNALGVERQADLTMMRTRLDFAFEAEGGADSVTFSGTCVLSDIILTKGTIPVEWAKSPLDPDTAKREDMANDYLRKAIAEASTTINGGLVLTQMLKMGHYRRDNNDGVYKMTQETGGVSGVMNDGSSPFTWGGGTMQQAINAIDFYKNDPSAEPTDDDLEDFAKFVVTHGGRAILEDVILRGYIYALGGLFRGGLQIGKTDDQFVINASTGEVTMRGRSAVIDDSNGTPDPESSLLDLLKIVYDYDPDTLRRIIQIVLSSSRCRLLLDAEKGISCEDNLGLNKFTATPEHLEIGDSTNSAELSNGEIILKSSTLVAQIPVERTLRISGDGKINLKEGGADLLNGSIYVDENGFLKISSS